jgi:hypothetical protein
MNPPVGPWFLDILYKKLERMATWKNLAEHRSPGKLTDHQVRIQGIQAACAPFICKKSLKRTVKYVKLKKNLRNFPRSWISL